MTDLPSVADRGYTHIMSKQLDGDNPDIALLGFFRDSPLHGYELHRRLQETGGMALVWTVKQAQLYARLDALESEGLLSSTLEPQETRPPRRVYSLTDLGRVVFDAWLVQPAPRPHEIRLGFMRKLYFARDAGPETLHRLVVAQKTLCSDWMDRQAAVPGQSDFAARVREYRRGQLAMTIVWLESLLHPLEEK